MCVGIFGRLWAIPPIYCAGKQADRPTGSITCAMCKTCCECDECLRTSWYCMFTITNCLKFFYWNFDHAL